MPVLLAHAIEDSTDIFGIWGGFEPPKPLPLGTPLDGIDSLYPSVHKELTLYTV